MPKLSQEALELHDPFQGPVPGQALTNSPDQKYPWDTPPEETNVKQATERVFLEILKDENLERVATLMNNNVPIADIAGSLVFIGFTKGKWNPDLGALLMEPIMYMLLALSEHIGILNPAIYKGEDDEGEEELDKEEMDEEEITLKQLEGNLRKPKKMQPTIDASKIPQAIKERIENIDVSKIKQSLLAPSEQQEQMEAPEKPNSLLQRK